MKAHVMSGILSMTLLAGACAAESIYKVPVEDIEGKATTLEPYKGKTLLIVNVASKCGHTPQYAGLQALQEKYGDKGFAVLGFPCNQFGGQEPGSKEQIKEFCSSKYHVTFPMFNKVEVNGPNRHPLYSILTGKESPAPGNIKWNFTKFLVGPDGTILKRFEPGTKPDAPEVVKAVESSLKAK